MPFYPLVLVSLLGISCTTLEGSPRNKKQAVSVKPLALKGIEKIDLGAESTTKKSKTSSKVSKKAKKYKYVLAPKKLNRQVKKWVRYYSKKDRKRFQRFLNQGARYKNVIQTMFSNYKIPPELYYLGILESGYRTNAVSHAGAVGAWQFMRPTGREYGLSINNYVDERLDPMRSTVAAAKYLKELYRQSKDWKLALASYNAGPGRVRRAIRRGGKNFWTLSRRRLLPRDTRHYIPQFLAIVHIGNNLKKYGFNEIPKEFYKGIHLVTVPSPVRLKDISQITKIPTSRLKKMNPHLKKGITPPNFKLYDLWLPKAKALQLVSRRPALEKKVVKGLRVRRQVRRRKVTRTVHRVRRGDNLTSIAKRYGKTIRFLKKRNSLRSSRIRIGQKLRLTGRATKVAKAKKRRRYRVRRGDSLISISKRFKTTVRLLRKLNNIKGNRLLSGKYITVAKN